MRAPVVVLIMVLAACGSSGEPASPEGPRAADPLGPSATTPTWYRDVEPIVQRECVSCHVSDGTGGFLLDRQTAVLIGPVIADRVARGYMPPWPPGPASAPLVESRRLTDDAIGTIVGWVGAGMPLGDPRDHVERGTRAARLPARPPELHLELPPGDAYAPPSSPFVVDEIRCFVLDLPDSPALASGAWVTASRWRAGHPIGIHSLAGVPLDQETARAARGRQGRDGRPGFECGGGLGDLAHGPPLGANGTGAAADGSMLPEGTAVIVPAGGAVLMRVHYAVKHLGNASDRSSVDLWLASEAERAQRRALELHVVSAPAELPCPTGLTADATSPCNRDNAFSRLAPAPEARAPAVARADALLASCGTTLEAYTSRLAFTPSAPDHFFVSSTCANVAPFDGVVRVVHARMQTRGASVRVETEETDGSWASVLDIPAWRWAWDGAYVLERGVPVHAGRKVRVTCTFDNGLAAQWSALTGEPGHDAPVHPPVLPPQYVIAAENRAAETCMAFLGIERGAPSKAQGQTRRSSQVDRESP